MQPATREEWKAWLGQALAAAADGTELPLVTSSGGRVVGSTRFLALRPEHGSVEIGWTWLHPSAWGTGANVEAKLLQLRHAFEMWGCRRVELKTDALNERSRCISPNPAGSVVANEVMSRRLGLTSGRQIHSPPPVRIDRPSALCTSGRKSSASER